MTLKTNEIIKDRTLGLTYEELAAKYNCSKSTVSNALKHPDLELVKRSKKERSKEFKPNVKLGIRFFGWLARTLGIKNSSNMNLKELKTAISQKLLEY